MLSTYGLINNGLVLSDCTEKRVHFRSNIVNTGNSMSTDSPGEDVTFYYDSVSQSVVRYDAIGGTSGVINRVSDVDFIYLTVIMADVRQQPTNQTVTLTSDVTLRNSPYMLGQY